MLRVPDGLSFNNISLAGGLIDKISLETGYFMVISYISELHK